jgi:hypothetical protein
MDVVGVDERTGGAEVDFPVYRVYFFDRLYGVLSSGDAYTYELTGANNVQQVLAWADANARGRTYAVYVVTPHNSDPRLVTLLQLAGDDPNNPVSDRAAPLPSLQASAELAGAERMHQRRERARERGSPGGGTWING